MNDHPPESCFSSSKKLAKVVEMHVGKVSRLAAGRA